MRLFSSRKPEFSGSIGMFISLYKTADTGARKQTTPYLYLQPSSWRWTFGFETCRRYCKN